MGCDTVQFGRSLPMFQRNVLPLSSGQNRKSSKQQKRRKQNELYLLLACYLIGLIFNLDIPAVSSSETSVNSCPITRRHIPEDSILYNSSCDSFISQGFRLNFALQVLIRSSARIFVSVGVNIPLYAPPSTCDRVLFQCPVRVVLIGT